MSILIFAPPQPGLAQQSSEVAALINCFHRPLLAHSEDELRQCVETSDESIEGFWFVGHSGAAGVVADGRTMAVRTLAQYLSTAAIEWSFFNSCESLLFIDELQKLYSHDCYAYITEIADIAAWRTARLVARNYSNVGNILQAVQTAAPAGTTPLRYFPNPVGGQRMSQKDLESVQELSEQIAELTKVLTGDGRYQRSGLIKNVRHLENRLTAIMEEQERQRAWLLLNSAMMVAILIIEIFIRWR